mmetsp:Transcript_70316/g.139409  ORF Transcript_70316/g.139409 Transcript_70316/m.139409 type:complete len:255 (+) Transcript_70316:270-1034(+)
MQTMRQSTRLHSLGPRNWKESEKGLSVKCSRPVGLGSTGLVLGTERPWPAGRRSKWLSGTICTLIRISGSVRPSKPKRERPVLRGLERGTQNFASSSSSSCSSASSARLERTDSAASANEVCISLVYLLSFGSGGSPFPGLAPVSTAASTVDDDVALRDRPLRHQPMLQLDEPLSLLLLYSVSLSLSSLPRIGSQYSGEFPPGLRKSLRNHGLSCRILEPPTSSVVGRMSLSHSCSSSLEDLMNALRVTGNLSR